MIKVLIFDFNGVIVESTDTNARIYAKIFEPYGPEVVKKVMEHYNANGGIPRQARLELYLREFAGIEPDKELIDRMSAEFSRLYLESLKKARLVPGVREFMEGYGKKYMKMLSSGAPQADIPQMLKILSLDKYFTAVFGAPRKKAEHIAFILKNWKLKPDQAVFIGDSPKDRDAALENNIHFIARPRGLKSLSNEKYQINDLFDLPHVLEKLEN